MQKWPQQLQNHFFLTNHTNVMMKCESISPIVLTEKSSFLVLFSLSVLWGIDIDLVPLLY